MTELLNCLVCGSTAFFNYLNLGDQPLANSYSEVANEELPKYPLRVNFCRSCSHNQLSEMVDPAELYKNYLYVSGTSQTLKDHFANLAQDCSSRLRNVGERFSALSIGCNDATDLEAFAALGFHVHGVDPAENLRPLSQAKSINVEVAFWDEEMASKIGKFDVIFGCNVFAHNPDPIQFLKNCKTALTDEGLVAIEFPLYTNTVRTGDIGQIYHEHISYYTLKSMSMVAEAAGLHIQDIVEFPNIHGGTVRIIMRDISEHSEKVLNMIQTEKTQGFHDIAIYENFSATLILNLKKLKVCIESQRLLGFTVIGYGAAAKTSTLLNSAPGHFNVEYIVDDAPLKIGRFVPGTDIPVKSTSDFGLQPGMASIILFAHNYKEEIRKRIKAIRRPGDAFINLVPGISVEDVYEK